MGRTTTAADGTYHFGLGGNGRVTVTALPVAGLMDPPAPITVTPSFPGQILRVDVVYDTGIR